MDYCKMMVKLYSDKVIKYKITNLDPNGFPKRKCEAGISDECKKRKLTIPYNDHAMKSISRENVWCCVECFEIKLNTKIPKKDWKNKGNKK